MSAFLKDFRYALRTLRRSPGFTLVALLTIALGIGASSAIFSVANAVLLRPLPYADPTRLVVVWGDLVARKVVDFPFAPGDLPDLREQGTLFDSVAGVNTFRGFTPNASGDPEPVTGGQATINLFSVLGVKMAAGRDFVDQDGTPNPQPPPAQAGGAAAPNAGGRGTGAAPATGATAAAAPAPAAPPPPRLPNIAILSYAYWQRHFGGDTAIVGQNVDFLGRRVQVVGVLPPDFELLFAPRLSLERVPDVWTALRTDFSTASRINVFLRVIARLKPGVTLAQAQAQADKIAIDLQNRFAIKKTAGLHLRVEPMQADLVKDVQPAIWTLMGAVLFVLLIACANVANLLLVRASARERELSIRAAIGGTQWRLVRQLLAESLVLSLGGAVLGVLLAQFGVRMLMALQPVNLPRLQSVAIDRTVLLFATGLAMISAFVFGLIPAIRASRPNVMDVLRQSGSSGLRAGRLLRSTVVMVEVALSFALLVGAGLMVRSFVALQRANPGYEAAGLLTFLVQANGPNQNQPAGRLAFQRQLREQFSALPNVQSVSATGLLPLDGSPGANARWGTDEALTDASKFRQADVHIVLPGYFDAMRTRLVEGRAFTDADNESGRAIVILDTITAAHAFPGRPAVGQHVQVRVRSDQPEPFEVIGVVRHERQTSLSQDSRDGMYMPDGVLDHGVANRWVLRTTADPAQLIAAIKPIVTKLDARAVVAEAQPMQVFVDKAMAPTRFALTLIGVFSGIAVLLAAIGLYGVLATSVRQRTAEIGVRMAFGASYMNILGLVIGQGVRLSLIGVALGFVAAFSLTRFMETMLVGVTPTDPATFAGIAVLFLVIAMAASWIPARRAAGLSPTMALRDE